MMNLNPSPAITALLGLLLMAGCTPRAEEAPAPPAPANAPESGPPPAVAASSADLYRQHCQGCHGDKGQGVKGAGVPIAREAGEEEAELRQVIRNGKGKKMPAFKDTLTDAQITAIIQHLRTLAGGAAESGGEREEREHPGESEGH